MDPLEQELESGRPERGAEELQLDGRRLVFIGGLHRSGTSLVHRCLSDHPDISGFSDTGVAEDEGQHLQSVYPRAVEHGGPGLFGFKPRAYLDETSALVTQNNARRILQDWSEHWDTTRSILVEKSPPNLIRTRFLQALFPGCRFIVVIRHPIAVGYATQKWTTWLPWLRALGVPDRRLPHTWIHVLVRHWLACHESFEEDRAFLEKVHVLRYEDFVEQPQEHLDQIHSFLGLDPAPITREVRRGVNDRYWTSWLTLRDRPLGRAYWSWVVRRFEDRVRRFGYSLQKKA